MQDCHTTPRTVSVQLNPARGRDVDPSVKVVTVKPGPVDTPMTQGMDRDRLLFLISAAARGTRVAYVPARWRGIMFVLRNIPSVVFQRLDL